MKRRSVTSLLAVGDRRCQACGTKLGWGGVDYEICTWRGCALEGRVVLAVPRVLRVGRASFLVALFHHEDDYLLE